MLRPTTDRTRPRARHRWARGAFLRLEVLALVVVAICLAVLSSSSTPAHAELDICDAGQVARAFAKGAPRVVVNCAALTKVDTCEREPALAARVNASPRLRVNSTGSGRGKSAEISVFDLVIAILGSANLTTSSEPSNLELATRLKYAREAAIRP